MEEKPFNIDYQSNVDDEQISQNLNYNGDNPELSEEQTKAFNEAVTGKPQLTPIELHELMRKVKTKTLVRKHKKIGRNEECPCGSGKKYKNCCLNEGTFEGYEVDPKQKKAA